MITVGQLRRVLETLNDKDLVFIGDELSSVKSLKVLDCVEKDKHIGNVLLLNKGSELFDTLHTIYHEVLDGELSLNTLINILNEGRLDESITKKLNDSFHFNIDKNTQKMLSLKLEKNFDLATSMFKYLSKYDKETTKQCLLNILLKDD